MFRSASYSSDPRLFKPSSAHKPLPSLPSLVLFLEKYLYSFQSGLNPNRYDAPPQLEGLISKLLKLPRSTKRSSQNLEEFLHSDMILAKSVTTPFGSRPLVFADFIASGRPLQCVETAIQEHVLPYYSNTHTETGLLGRLMTDLCQDARNTIKRQCHADPNEYACLFLGSGSTSALNRVACLLDLKSTATSVVFVSSAEHHSNLLIWREMGMKVVSIPTVLATGCIDLTLLEESLVEHSTYSSLIGSFTAASNIVGSLQPVHKIARLMHKYNGLALFDYACAAPYVAIEMSPSHLDPLEHLDAVMISPHKFIGGPGTPGILIIRKRICRMGAAPVSPGGGAVAWVNGWGYHAYVQDFETREEAGTPDALLTPDYITSKCLDLTCYAMQQLSKAPNITILGPPSFSMDSKADSVHYSKLPIFAILVQGPSLCGKGKLLHFNYVSKLLTDVFGIQTRGGCSCASPYFMELSQVTAQEELQRRNAYLPDATSNVTKEGMKPGFTRFNLSYTHSKAEVDYILGAVKWVSEHGWKLLTVYEHDWVTGSWAARVNDPSLMSATIDFVRKKISVGLLVEAYGNRALTAAATAGNRFQKEIELSKKRRQEAKDSHLLDWYLIDADVFTPKF